MIRVYRGCSPKPTRLCSYNIGVGCRLPEFGNAAAERIIEAGAGAGARLKSIGLRSPVQFKCPSELLSQVISCRFEVVTPIGLVESLGDGDIRCKVWFFVQWYVVSRRVD